MSAKPLRVLIVEDSEEDALLAIEELKQSGFIPIYKRVETAEGMMAALRSQAWDIVFSDYTMPRFGAPAALRLLLESEFDLPFIIVSGTVGEETAVSIMKAGAQDYIMKHNLARLVPAVERELREAEARRDRKRTERALRESEARFKDLYDNAPLGYHEYDKEGRITQVNRTSLEMLGYEADEMIGQPVWTFSANGGTVREEVQAKLAGRLPPGQTFERTFRRKNGSTFPVLIENRLLRDEKGEIKGIRSAIQDITRLKQVEQALRESEEAARRLAQENAIMAEIGRIISSTLNIDEVCDRLSKEVEKLIPFDRISVTLVDLQEGTTIVSYAMGVDVPDRRPGTIISLKGTATEIVVQTCSGLIMNAGDEKGIIERFPGVVLASKSGFQSTMIVPLISKDQIIGVLHILSSRQDSYKENDLRLAERIGNQIAGAVANAQLFSERKRMEEEKEEIQEQLRQSQKMEAIGRLAGGIAHDFNNLLTIIKGYSQLSLLDLKEGDPLLKNIEEIQKAADRATTLVRQLLAFSRRQVMEMIVIDLNSLIRDLDKMLRRVIGEDIVLMTLLTEDLGRVKGDPGQIEQVIMNLAVNARDAMPTGGKLIIETVNSELDENFVHGHLGVTPGPYVMLSVSDSGSGMKQEVREKIFEPFFTTKERGKGTGLGLSTVYGIVKQSGGHIWVYSEPGHGTTFKIFFPRIDEAPDIIKLKTGSGELPRGSETVLVVEDEKEVRSLASNVLKRQGYRVLEASNGGIAFLLCEQHQSPIDLMLTDVVMPEMNGRELAERVAGLHPEMKVLFMSGHTDDAIVQHGILEKHVNYIQKPFTVENLARKVREVLEG
jgi:PAS domain S-box-containing protein